MRKKSSTPLLVFLLFFISFLAGGGFIYTSAMFEREKPRIDAPSQIYWNLKDPISITLKDNVGIKFYSIILSDGENSINLKNELLQTPQKEHLIELAYPRRGFFTKKERLKLFISVLDNSKWNYFSGNKTTQTIDITLDTKRPLLQVLDASYGIRKGGSALVAFEAKDENLKSLFIQTNYGKTFTPTPFYKDGYYVSLVAWPVNVKDFSATLIAEDKAGNRSQSPIRYYLKTKRYNKSNITLQDSFLNGKISELALEESRDNEKLSLVQRFKYVNETMRNQNEALIEKLTSKSEQQLISDFKIEPFYPLRNGAAVASFGDHRFFFKDGQQVSESLHVGLDLASIKNAPIETSNPGIVIHDEYNGIYGLNLILYHGLGIYSLYGHCNTINFQKNEIVKRGDVVATTGVSGLALGDHLHFGILVQGVEVRPEEWMDTEWIKLNIYDILDNAKKSIDARAKM